jgi:hypothetical protein
MAGLVMVMVPVADLMAMVMMVFIGRGGHGRQNGEAAEGHEGGEQKRFDFHCKYLMG